MAPPNMDEIEPTSFADSIAVKPIPGSDNAFRGFFPLDWCVGLVPHGGFITSVVTSAACTYCCTEPSFKARDQPDTISVHIDFLSRCSNAPATITVTPIKPGRQFSVMRVEIFQTPPGASKEILCVTAMVTQGNISKEVGITLKTPSVIPLSEIPNRLRDCIEMDEPGMNIRHAAFKLRYYVPRDIDRDSRIGRLGWSGREQWVKFRDGTLFDNSALGLLSDLFLPVGENLFPRSGPPSRQWYPTLNLDLEIKKSGSWEWLYVRVRLHVMKNGRNDLEVIIMDEEGDVVAFSKHVCLVLGIERNLKGRKAVKGSKV